MALFLIVGKNYSPLTKKVEAAGHSWLLLKDSSKNRGYSKKRTNTYYADLSTRETTKEALEGLTQQVDGILNIYENYVLATAWIGEILNLPAMSEDAALACSDKSVMRELFASAERKISPAFGPAAEWSVVEAFADEHGFPLILKPVNLSKSLLVTKCHTMQELREAFDVTWANANDVYAKYAPGKQPTFQVEEFMEGRIFSVDGYADAQGDIHMLDVVVDYESGYDIGLDDNFHYSRIIPSSTSKEDQKRIIQTAAIAMKSLGMISSPAHCELILTKDGPMMVEIGARNGGYRDRMHGLANDIDIYGNMMQLALDQPIVTVAKRHDGCAVLEVFPKQKGTFVELSNEQALRALSSFEDVRIIPDAGEVIGKSSQGYKMAARIVLYNQDIDQFHADLAYIKENVAAVVS